VVWSDLKAENFVLIGSSNEKEVKGIDLESAVPIKLPPEDYSPEACPPEFASMEKAGVGYEFQCQKNYDIWSLGMLFYELAVGRNYFAGQSEGNMLNQLANQDKIADRNDPATVSGLEAIGDDRYRDLVRSCLSIDPKKRPSIGQILLHPYFLTTGLGPLTF
jgi:serine/threonine protein kinase